jgi:leader peptidase (prepilin peptidase)/N-methyltransferase
MTLGHHAELAALLLVVGSCVGSFLNVCLYRIPLGLSLLRPRSRCPHCRTAIALRDNVPVLGWMILRGRCRYCRSAISPRYPIIELMVGILFAASYLVQAALLPYDLWEDSGPLSGLVLNLLSWPLIIAVVAAVVTGLDARGSSRTLTLGSGIRR